MTCNVYCNCIQETCYNIENSISDGVSNPQHVEARRVAILTTLDRNPNAFRPKTTANVAPAATAATAAAPRQQQGVNNNNNTKKKKKQTKKNTETAAAATAAATTATTANVITTGIPIIDNSSSSLLLATTTTTGTGGTTPPTTSNNTKSIRHRPIVCNCVKSQCLKVNEKGPTHCVCVSC